MLMSTTAHHTTATTTIVLLTARTHNLLYDEGMKINSSLSSNCH